MIDPAIAAGADPPRLATGPLVRRLLALSWPVVIARATQAVIGFSDALLVSPLGEESLAAVTTGAFNTFCLVILPMGTSFILQSFAAQLRGKGELGAAGRYAWYGLILALGAGLSAACAIPLVPLALHRFGYAPAVERQMGVYMSIRLLSVGAVVGTEALGNWYGGLGNTRVAMVAGATAMSVNVLGCLALIEPRFGLPGFGVAGAGWASVLASWSGFAVVLVRLAREKEIAVRRPGALRLSELKRVLSFGLPNGANWFLEFGAFALFINVVTAHLGTSALAAFNVVIQVNSISFMPAWGVGTAGSILVGEAIGRGKEGRGLADRAAHGCCRERVDGHRRSSLPPRPEGAHPPLRVARLRRHRGDRRDHAHPVGGLAALRRNRPDAIRGASRGRRHLVAHGRSHRARLGYLPAARLARHLATGRWRRDADARARDVPGAAGDGARLALRVRTVARDRAGRAGRRRRMTRAGSGAWFVYVARCADGTLYVGITLDVAARIAAHDAGRGARYTRGRGPLAVLATRRCRVKGDALRLELALKRLARDEKLALCASPRKLAKLARTCARR